jgi:TRAP-type transport system periplasmic protein
LTRVAASFALGCALALFAGFSAVAQQFTVKVSSPTVNDVTHEWMKKFKNGVEARSGGKIKVEIYPAGQLGQIPTTVEGVAMGTIEVAAPATGFLIGIEPRFLVFDTPGLFDDLAHAQRVLADPALSSRFAAFGQAKGIEPLAIYPHGPLMVLTHKGIRSTEDFRGQKIRVPGPAPLQIEPLRKLGALPISMSLGEVLPAMQNRTIDGLTASASVFTAFKYYDVAKTLTKVPGSVIVVAAVANRDFLKSLGPDLAKIVREEAERARADTAPFALSDAERVLKVWRENGGEIVEMQPDQGKKYLAEVTSVLPPILKGNAKLKDDYDALLDAVSRVRK